ncbi:MAG: GSU2403 family nucleotidyltransferase fold protein [Candidatus Omnitrophica bacterium]|nr:GSU2403 family nucleotidyltransferase fold protein [Candidatus Omnitrophota bacterium]
MEKKQSELCLEVLRRFHKANILGDLILIGSWCVYFYDEYFADTPYAGHTAIKTRDLDFLIDNPARIKHAVNVPDLLQDLGFVTDFKGRKGYIRLDHPELILEFLVPERGKGTDKPVPLPKLGLNAAALRFLSFLSGNTIRIKIEDFYLTLPHPANFALHKLIIFQRRTKEEKAAKDRNTAVAILKALINKGEINIVKKVFNSALPGWQTKILKGLKEANENEILDILK